jgi:hypothetical protein
MITPQISVVPSRPLDERFRHRHPVARARWHRLFQLQHRRPIAHSLEHGLLRQIDRDQVST